MVIDGRFRDDLDVSGISFQYSALKEFAQPGEEYSPDEIETQYEQITEEPKPYGAGPLLASSSVAVVMAYPPVVCHDVNGYYRALGVGHLANRKELRQAYQRIQGQRSEYLTFVLTQLLNPVVRRVYDTMPLGSIYLDDPYIQDRIKRAAYQEAARRRMAGHDSTALTILAEWGFAHEDEKEFPEIAEKALDLSEERVIVNEWAFAYYLWQSAPQADNLKEWQTLLIQELAALGIVTHFAVGRMGGEGYLYLKVDDNHVFFLNTINTPNQTQAAEAAQTFKDHNGI